MTRPAAERAKAALAALKRAHIALAEQAGKDQAAIERVRALAEELATRGNARTGNEKTLGRRILAALDEQQEQP
ncbi:hypothetical protein ACIGO8_08250 [Streptomyces sp. NPDC053493]|uniref:hypothetical protein n=1 Tax=Streptomyces sp. NPDC053493 TaxID=3365705 RepID=UPI0037CFF62D